MLLQSKKLTEATIQTFQVVKKNLVNIIPYILYMSISLPLWLFLGYSHYLFKLPLVENEISTFQNEDQCFLYWHLSSAFAYPHQLQFHFMFQSNPHSAVF